MKRRRYYGIFVAASLSLTMLLFAACGGEKGKAAVKESGRQLLVLEGVKSGGSVADALESLKKDGALTYGGTVDGLGGVFITSVNGYTADSENHEFWAIFTTLEEYEGVFYSSTEFGTYEYGGVTLGSAYYGVSGLPLVQGELYVFTIMTW